MFGKTKGAFHQSSGALRVFHLPGDLVKVGLAMIFIEEWFRIEQIHLARPTIHEKVDYRLCLRGKVRLTGLEVGRLGGESFRAKKLGRKRRILVEQIGKGRTADASRHSVKQIPSGKYRGTQWVFFSHRVTVG